MKYPAFLKSITLIAASWLCLSSQVRSQEIADVCYYDLTGTAWTGSQLITGGEDLNHAALFAGWNSSGDPFFYEVEFYDRPQDVTKTVVRGVQQPGRQYFGAFRPSTMDDLNKRKSVLSSALDVVNQSIPYPNLALVLMGAANPSQWTGQTSQINEIRCDGLVEFAYERNGHKAWWDKQKPNEWNVCAAGALTPGAFIGLLGAPHTVWINDAVGFDRKPSPKGQRNGWADGNTGLSAASLGPPSILALVWSDNSSGSLTVSARDVDSGVHHVRVELQNSGGGLISRQSTRLAWGSISADRTETLTNLTGSVPGVLSVQVTDGAGHTNTQSYNLARMDTRTVGSGTGTVSSPQRALQGTTVTYSASPDNSSVFVGWRINGNSEIVSTSLAYTRQVPASGGTLRTDAEFAQQQGTINVVASPTNGGTVSGGGSFAVGSSRQISATANSGWTFTGWSDGVSTNPRNVTVASGTTTYTANFSQTPTVSITINTNPAGRSYVFNGTTYSSPQTFNLTPGSTFTLSTTATQSGTTGTQFVFSQWADGNTNANRGTLTVPSSATTYTANFTTQYYLTMVAGSGGTVSPASGWLNAGASVSISASANSGQSFNGWTGSGTVSYTGPINSATVTMNGPITQTASFIPTPTSTTISPPTQTVTSVAQSYPITVTSNTSWSASSNQSWAVVSPTSGTGNGTVIVSVTANTSSSSRDATITIGGQPHSLAQTAPNPADVTASHLLSPSSYNAGSTVSLTASFSYPASRSILSLLWRPQLPPGWTIASVSGDGGPELGGGEVLFLAGNITQNPVQVTALISVPAGQSGEKTLSSEFEYQLNQMLNPVTIRATPDPLTAPQQMFHDADYRDARWVIDGTEMNRVLSYWRAGGYRSATSSETTPDGFAAGTGTRIRNHSADFRDTRGIIDGTEMNRVLSYWRAGAYHVKPDPLTDGYAAGTGALGMALMAEAGEQAQSASSFTATHQIPTTYTAGSAVPVTVTMNSPGSLWSLLVRPEIPSGWTVQNVSGTGNPEFNFGEALWLGSTIPTGEILLTYDLIPPAGATGTVTVRNHVEYQLAGALNPVEIQATPNPATLTPSGGLVIAPNGNTVTAAAQNYAITVTGSGSWQASSDQTWATVSPSSGTSNGTVTVTVTANIGSTSRSAVITIGGQTHNLTQSAPITGAKRLLYLKQGNPADWTVPGAIGSKSIEIGKWQAAGYTVDTADASTTALTTASLANYQAVRLHWSPFGDDYPDAWGAALDTWVRAGGVAIIEGAATKSVNATKRFGVQTIQGQNGGSSGTQWIHAGAPLLIGPVAAPLAVSQVACEQMDRAVLSPGHSLQVIAERQGDPAIAWGQFGQGKVVIHFFMTWSQDASRPQNAFRAAIGEGDNLQYVDKLIVFAEETVPVVLATVTTTPASSVTNNSAATGGNVTNSGGGTVSARGVVYSTGVNPALGSGTNVPGGSGLGSFNSNLTGLSPSTTYYMRAYATNEAGTAYGSQIQFTTLAAPIVLATVTTTPASSVTHNSATTGGNVTNSGGGTVSARGVVYSTGVNPALGSGTIVPGGSGLGSFTSNLTGLSPSTTYYVRAYATNEAGTAYGSQIQFTMTSQPTGPGLVTHSAGGYRPGANVDVQVTIDFEGANLSGLGYSLQLPPGWSYVQDLGNAGVKPQAGDTGALEWAWFTIPSGGTSMTVTLAVPSSATGAQSLVGQALFSNAQGVNWSVAATPNPLVLQVVEFHSADQDGNWRISLSELLSVIALYNHREGSVRTGDYHWNGSSFAPGIGGAGQRSRSPHSADVNSDWKIGLQELLGVITLYNYRQGTTRTGEYHYSASEGRFLPGPNSLMGMMMAMTPPTTGELAGDLAESPAAGNGIQASLVNLAGNLNPAGGVAQVRVDVAFNASELGSLGMEIQLPAGWSLASQNSTAPVFPSSNQTGMLEWAWFDIPSSPMSFVIQVNYPSADGPVNLTGSALATSNGGTPMAVPFDLSLSPRAQTMGNAPDGPEFARLVSGPFQSIQVVPGWTTRFLSAQSTGEDGAMGAFSSFTGSGRNRVTLSGNWTYERTGPDTANLVLIYSYLGRSYREDYFCNFTARELVEGTFEEREDGVLIDEGTFSFALIGRPSRVEDEIPFGAPLRTRVGESVAIQVAGAQIPADATVLSVSGLPTGLRYDVANGRIVGQGQKGGIWLATVRYRQTDGSVRTVQFQVEVAALPTWAVGAFFGLVDREATPAEAGGALSFNVAGSGAVSGTLRMAGGTFGFTGRVSSSVDSEVVTFLARINRRNALPIHLELTLAEGHLISGVMSVGGISTPINGWQQTWDRVTPVAAGREGMVNALLDLEGDAVGDVEVPQGSGFASLTVARTGGLRWVGRTGDGAAFSQSVPLGPNGEAALWAALYRNTASVQALALLDSMGGLDGAGTWVKQPQTRASERLYRAGFGADGDPVQLKVIGAKWVRGVSALQAGELKFRAGGLDATAGELPDIGFTLDARGRVQVSAPNLAQVRFTAVAGTGRFTGSFVLKDDNPERPGRELVRRVTFQGLIVPGATPQGGGYFVLPQLAEPPATTGRTSPILSGEVRVE